MKKILFIVFLTFICISPAYSAQKSGSLTVSVSVQGKFFLMVNSDSFDFANLNPGQTGEISKKDGLTVVTASTNGNPCYLKVSCSRPLSSGTDYIPNDNFTWYGTSEGKGEFFGTTDKSFADTTATAYVSTPSESGDGTKISSKFKFRLHVPEDTKPGSYTTTVMFTMTE